ncbi:hypothetical protein CC2G_013561 [Coprinopsis cinerea AmutBmut pab1-1]|nr:hypothetical protein CC2G_013561 [Coprinopsis cinerea AmutBmut pab1-1]
MLINVRVGLGWDTRPDSSTGDIEFSAMRKVSSEKEELGVQATQPVALPVGVLARRNQRKAELKLDTNNVEWGLNIDAYSPRGRDDQSTKIDGVSSSESTPPPRTPLPISAALPPSPMVFSEAPPPSKKGKASGTI